MSEYRPDEEARAPAGGEQGIGEPAVGVAVVDVWAFRVDPGLESVDLTGFSVEATDGGIGKVDEASHEVGASALIVDTGPWIFGKKVMLPAGVVDHVDPDSKSVFVNRTKEEIKNAPEYDDTVARDEDYRRRLGSYYGREGH